MQLFLFNNLGGRISPSPLLIVKLSDYQLNIEDDFLT